MNELMNKSFFPLTKSYLLLCNHWDYGGRLLGDGDYILGRRMGICKSLGLEEACTLEKLTCQISVAGA